MSVPRSTAISPWSARLGALGCLLAAGCSGADHSLGAGPTCAESCRDASPDATGGGATDADSLDSPDEGLLQEGAADLDAGAEASGPKACPQAHGPKMVRVPSPEGGSFCIDVTEVTNSQYSDFLGSKNGDVSGQSADCAVNTTYAPGTSLDCTAALSNTSTRPNYPVACVDWCDAVAYCAWAGKQLCGDVRGQPVDLSNPYVVEPAFYVACVGPDTDGYEYGTNWMFRTCDDSEYAMPGVRHGSIPVGSDSNCHGPSAPYSLIYDLLGNVAEWQDNACAAGQCAMLGGSYVDDRPSCFDGVDPNLEPAQTADNQFIGPFIGFRCCAY